MKLPAQGLSLEDWVERQNTTSYPLPKILEQRKINVAGQPAIYQLEQFGSHVSPAIFIKKDNRVYIINPSSNQDKYKQVIDDFVKNFEFN